MQYEFFNNTLNSFHSGLNLFQPGQNSIQTKPTQFKSGQKSFQTGMISIQTKLPNDDQYTISRLRRKMKIEFLQILIAYCDPEFWVMVRQPNTKILRHNPGMNTIQTGQISVQTGQNIIQTGQYSIHCEKTYTVLRPFIRSAFELFLTSDAETISSRRTGRRLIISNISSVSGYL